MALKSVKIERFKSISETAFDLRDVNVLIGGNNSGKSSIVQALHFGISLLQIMTAWGRSWPKGPSHTLSLNPSEVLYSPSEDVHALGPDCRLSTVKAAFTSIEYVMDSGSACVVTLGKGKNRNILLSVSDTTTATVLAKLDKPFSLFSPGLAGVAKTEKYISDGVLFRALARGDANLVLRNILLRLQPHGKEDKQKKWDEFKSDLGELFPGIDIFVNFDENLGEYIDVQVATIKDRWVPLEIVGTGVLQAVQILSYIQLFSPSLMVLDEPDSHLHPNNQRLLCSLIKRVAKDRKIQFIITTHSRHMLDALGDAANVLWVRNGAVEQTSPDDEMGILLEIGALDVKEQVALPTTKVVILTEDELLGHIRCLAASAKLPRENTVVQSYYGVTSTKNLKPLVSMIRKTNPKAMLIVHRDRDYMSDEEAMEWEKDVRSINVEPFVTVGRDIESHLLNPAYLSLLNPQLTVEQFEQLLTEVIASNNDTMIVDFVNGKTDIAKKNGSFGKLNLGTLAVEAAKQIKSNPRRFSGKPILSALRTAFQAKTSASLKIGEESELIAPALLKTISGKLKH